MAAKIPKNIRFRPDQVEALDALETEETDFSTWVRIAVDEMLARRREAAAAERRGTVRYSLNEETAPPKKRQATRKRAA